MKKLFVIGNKSSESLSPLIFNYWFKKYKINAKYDFLQPQNKQLNKTVTNTLKDKNVIGLNITIPYKVKIIKLIKNLNKHAKKINAVNCVINKKQPTGINTDWIGYKRSLKGLKIQKSKHIIILGYGGAAQAIHYSFVYMGYSKITIFNRTKKLIQNSKNKTYTKQYNTIQKYLPKADLLINTTPTNPISKKLSKLVRDEAVVSDIVYKPKETKFLKSFKNNKKVFGITMLLNQAAPCFRVWFGFEPKIDKKLIDKLDKKIR